MGRVCTAAIAIAALVATVDLSTPTRAYAEPQKCFHCYGSEGIPTKGCIEVDCGSGDPIPQIAQAAPLRVTGKPTKYNLSDYKPCKVKGRDALCRTEPER